MTRPMFPHAVDSTMLAAFRACPQKMYRSYVEHWKPKAESVHLVAGKAFATGIEAARLAYFEGRARDASGNEHEVEKGNRDLAEATGISALIKAYGNFDCPPDSAKSLERTAGALEFYYANYPLGLDGSEPVSFPDGRCGIEFSFAEALPDVVHPVTGDPILYTGRMDMVGSYAGGLYGFDEKTASQLGASWAKQWDLRSQFTGYTWACHRQGLPVQGVIVRGVSILKTKYDTQQAIAGRGQWEIDRWLHQTQKDVVRMIECWERGDWDYNLDHSCADYGGCQFTQVCKSPEPETWLPMYFEKRVWDPLAREELTVQQWEESWGHKTGATAGSSNSSSTSSSETSTSGPVHEAAQSDLQSWLRL